MKQLLIFTILFLVSACGAHNYARDNAYSMPGGSSSGGAGGGSGSGDCGGMGPVACETFNLVNAERLKAGLKPLAISTVAVQAAQEQSEDMQACGYFAHDRPDCPGKHGPETFAQRMGRWHLWGGENIAGGYMTPAAAVNGWMNSPGHRANILNTSYGSGGIGYVNNLYTQVFSN